MYVGVSPSFSVFIEVTTIIVVYLLFTYFPFLSFHGHAFRVRSKLSLQLSRVSLRRFSVTFQASASFREGIIALYTLLSFIFLPYPYGALPNSLFSSLVWLCFMSSSVHPLFVKLKHFLCVSFFLYLYYSRNFPFVKRFLKVFSRFLMQLFDFYNSFY